MKPTMTYEFGEVLLVPFPYGRVAVEENLAPAQKNDYLFMGDRVYAYIKR